MRKWSNLKKRVESFFASSVAGVVELRAVSYNRAHDHDGRGYITVNGVEVWDMCTLKYYPKEVEKVYEQLGNGASDIGSAQTAGIAELDREGTHSQFGFYRLLDQYCSNSIDTSLASEIPLIKCLALLDARTGKRRLKKITVDDEHEMVRYFYKLRRSLDEVTDDS